MENRRGWEKACNSEIFFPGRKSLIFRHFPGKKKPVYKYKNYFLPTLRASQVRGQTYGKKAPWGVPFIPRMSLLTHARTRERKTRKEKLMKFSEMIALITLVVIGEILMTKGCIVEGVIVLSLEIIGLPVFLELEEDKRDD